MDYGINRMMSKLTGNWTSHPRDKYKNNTHSHIHTYMSLHCISVNKAVTK